MTCSQIEVNNDKLSKKLFKGPTEKVLVSIVVNVIVLISLLNIYSKPLPLRSNSVDTSMFYNNATFLMSLFYKFKRNVLVFSNASKLCDEHLCFKFNSLQ